MNVPTVELAHAKPIEKIALTLRHRPEDKIAAPVDSSAKIVVRVSTMKIDFSG